MTKYLEFLRVPAADTAVQERVQQEYSTNKIWDEKKCWHGHR
jgi:hypothetical protein